MVYYNNLLSTMLLLPMCLFNKEFNVLSNPDIMNFNFISMNLMAGLLGFYLNFASLWCVAATSATTYAIVGSLNKVPITVLGFFLFETKMTHQGILYIAMASLGGLLFGYSKLPKK
jgi:GDP-mannose transporter